MITGGMCHERILKHLSQVEAFPGDTFRGRRRSIEDRTIPINPDAPKRGHKGVIHVAASRFIGTLLTFEILKKPVIKVPILIGCPPVITINIPPNLARDTAGPKKMIHVLRIQLAPRA